MDPGFRREHAVAELDTRLPRSARNDSICPCKCRPRCRGHRAPRRRSRRRFAPSCRARRHRRRAERRAYESDGLTAYRQPPLVVVLPSTIGAGRAVLRYCHGRADQGRAARRRHLALGRRVAAGRRHPARHGEVQPHPRHRLRQSLRRGAAGRHQSRHHRGGGGRRVSITRPIRRARSPARSAAMSRRIRAACIASNTASPPTTCSASRWC